MPGVEVLSSRILHRPSDFDAGRAWYRDVLGLRVYREYGTGVALWLQVPDVDAEHARLAAAGVDVLSGPVDEPWGLRECWVADPDGVRIALIEVPDAHPLRRRVD